MPLSTRAFRKPYLATTAHNSGGASSTAGQPKRTAVSQMRSILHCHSVALRHQYASDCLMRPFVTTVCSSDAAKLGDGFLDGFELLDEEVHSMFGVIQLFGLLEHFGGVRFRHHGHAILVGHDDIAGVHFGSGAGDGNLGAGKAVMIDGGGWGYAAAEDWELNAAELRGVAHGPIDDGGGKAAHLHRRGDE